MANESTRYFLEGPRIYLREVRVTDVNDTYYRWLNDPEVTRFLEVRYVPHSLENIRRFVESMDGKLDEVFLAISLKADDRHIGNIKLGPINWIHRSGDISLLIGEKDCWGKGYASEAIALICAHAFGTLNLRRLTAGCYSTNMGSAKAFEKVGFTREGVLRAASMVDQQPVDHILLGLLVEDYRKK